MSDKIVMCRSEIKHERADSCTYGLCYLFPSKRLCRTQVCSSSIFQAWPSALQASPTGIQSFKDLSRKEPYWGPPLYNSATTLQYFILHLYLTSVQRDSTKPKISGKRYFYSSTDETRSLTVMATLLSSASPLTVFWAATKDKQVRDARRKPAPKQGRTPVPVGLQQPAWGLLEALQQDRKACGTGDLVSNVTCSSWAAITTL